MTPAPTLSVSENVDKPDTFKAPPTFKFSETTRDLKILKVPSLSMETESMLRYMFNMIQVPFEKHCPKTRKNFLSYSYTLYKMAQIIGEDEMIEKF